MQLIGCKKEGLLGFCELSEMLSNSFKLSSNQSLVFLLNICVCFHHNSNPYYKSEPILIYMFNICIFLLINKVIHWQICKTLPLRKWELRWVWKHPCTENECFSTKLREMLGSNNFADNKKEVYNVRQT